MALLIGLFFPAKVPTNAVVDTRRRSLIPLVLCCRLGHPVPLCCASVSVTSMVSCSGLGAADALADFFFRHRDEGYGCPIATANLGNLTDALLLQSALAQLLVDCCHAYARFIMI